jgi:hypothetical protein
MGKGTPKKSNNVIRRKLNQMKSKPKLKTRKEMSPMKREQNIRHRLSERKLALIISKRIQSEK